MFTQFEKEEYVQKRRGIQKRKIKKNEKYKKDIKKINVYTGRERKIDKKRAKKILTYIH